MTLLLLAGTGDARRIAQGLADLEIDARASLAGVTREAAALALPVRIGGFGGDEGFRAFLRTEGITAVLDATHPFAARITGRSARICAEEGVPYLYHLRPAWVAGPEDDWTQIDREEDAALHIPPTATVFLGTGRKSLERFSNLEGRRVICRQIDPPTAPFPFEGGEFLIGRPPFSVARERDLFSQLGVDVLVVKNAGGAASRTKLTAAADLGLQVLMIRRPPPPAAEIVDTVAGALEWARRHGGR